MFNEQKQPVIFMKEEFIISFSYQQLAFFSLGKITTHDNPQIIT